ncbi:MAG TPA: D-alanyl-D-alanine carboxypeptidase [Caldilineae bacterium]|nr:D-alanyl-D-alanine carboxypeptidase [Caldilineae bacterium]
MHFTAAGVRRQGSRLLVWLILCLAWALVGFGPPVLTSGGTPPAWRLYPDQVRLLAATWRMPPLSARAALLADGETGEILLQHNADQPLPPASTTKMMTALVTLERARPDEIVIVPAEALIGNASMGLRAGEQLTVQDLLYGLLMVSGNDAAMALAYHVAGSPEAFVELMNRRAAEMGLKHTHFVNPHGLDAPGHVASAADLLAIAREGLAQPLFARIVATPRKEVAGRLLINRNELLTTYPGADGVKTGTTDAAGQCLVASATREGHRAISVVLGSNDRYADSRALLDHYFTYFGWRRLELPRNDLSRVRWPDGRVRELAAASAPEVFLPRWQWPLIRMVYVIEGDGTPGSPAGRAIFRVGPQVIAEVPLTWREP